MSHDPAHERYLIDGPAAGRTVVVVQPQGGTIQVHAGANENVTHIYVVADGNRFRYLRSEAHRKPKATPPSAEQKP